MLVPLCWRGEDGSTHQTSALSSIMAPQGDLRGLNSPRPETKGHQLIIKSEAMLSFENKLTARHLSL